MSVVYELGVLAHFGTKIAHLKSPFRSEKNLKFYSDFYVYLGKRLDRKAKVYFKIIDVTNWEIND